MVKIIVAGAAGRMGRAVLKAAYCDTDVRITGAFERPDNAFLGHDVGELIGEKPLDVPVHPDIRECLASGDVIIDFTQPSATLQHLKAAVKVKRAMVIGTTALPSALMKKIKESSKKIPIVQSPNMSVGVNLLFQLANLVGRTMNADYDVEIIETHHRHKRDAPSGTAIELARQIAVARQIAIEPNTVYGRQGETGERRRGTIGVHAVRGGDVVGDHQVSFLADGERIELVHRASSREAFARGAVMAAKFLEKKRSGFFNMQKVLGF